MRTTDPALDALDCLIRIRRSCRATFNDRIQRAPTEGERRDWTKWWRQCEEEIASLVRARRLIIETRKMIPMLKELAA